LKRLASSFSEEDLVRLFHLLAETEKQIKDAPHPRFQLEIGLVKLTHAIRLRTLDELIRRLEELESRLNVGGASGVKDQPAIKSPITHNQAPASKDQSGKSSSRSPGNGVGSITDEPPDFPDFDLTAPYEFDEMESAQPIRQASPREAQTQAGGVSIPTGHEVEAILKEVQKMNRGFVLAALEDAQRLEFRDGTLVVTFGNDDVLTKRIRDSGQLFREIGSRLFGRPINLEVKISGQVEEKIDEDELKRRRLRERAMQNPAVRLIMERTKAELLSVKEQEGSAPGPK
jgi:hypothetical protein